MKKRIDFIESMNIVHQMIPDPSLELRDLRLIRAIDSAGSATAAAKLLRLSQSAVSHQLRHLEERLGLSVFRREGRGLQITEAGRRLITLSHEMLEPLVALEAELRRGGDHPKRNLRIATQCYTAYHWLPKAMTRLAERHPEFRLEIVPEATAAPREAVLAGDLDLALCIGKTDDRRLCQRALFSDELVFVLPPAHRLARACSLSGDQLRDEHLIAYDIAAPDRQRVHNLLFPSGGGFGAVTRMPLTEAIVELVKAGAGISILARWSVAPQLQRGELVGIPFRGRGLQRRWVGTYARNTQLVAPIRTLLGILKDLGPPNSL